MPSLSHFNNPQNFSLTFRIHLYDVILYKCIQQYHAEGSDKHTIFNQNLSSSAPQKAEKKSSAPFEAEEISSASEEVEEERATQNKNK